MSSKYYQKKREGVKTPKIHKTPHIVKRIKINKIDKIKLHV
jgi:hypothetical protein